MGSIRDWEPSLLHAGGHASTQTSRLVQIERKKKRERERTRESKRERREEREREREREREIERRRDSSHVNRAITGMERALPGDEGSGSIGAVRLSD